MAGCSSTRSSTELQPQVHGGAPPRAEGGRVVGSRQRGGEQSRPLCPPCADLRATPVRVSALCFTGTQGQSVRKGRVASPHFSDEKSRAQSGCRSTVQILFHTRLPTTCPAGGVAERSAPTLCEHSLWERWALGCMGAEAPREGPLDRGERGTDWWGSAQSPRNKFHLLIHSGPPGRHYNRDMVQGLLPWAFHHCLMLCTL